MRIVPLSGPILRPEIVANLADNQEIDVTAMFGGATYFPYNTSRTLKFSSASDWSNYSIEVLYQNAYGFYIYRTQQAPTAATQVEFGVPFGQATQPSANFFYINKIVSVVLVCDFAAAAPATPSRHDATYGDEFRVTLLGQLTSSARLACYRYGLHRLYR